MTTREVFAKYTTPETFERIKEYETVSEMWENCLKQYPDAVAIEDDGKKYTYAQLEEDAAAFRTLLKTEGKETMRVGIIAPNSYAFVKAYLATVTLGCTAVILPAQLDEMSVFGCTMLYGIEKLVYGEGMEEKTKIVAAKRPDVQLISALATSEKKTALAAAKGETPCVMMFTGGTTGKSKCAVLSNRAVMQGTVNGCYGLRDIFGERYLLVLPLSHVFGLIRNLMTALYTGSAMFICRNNKDMFRDIAMFRPTVLVFVPALAEMSLMLSRKFGKNMLGDDLKYVICGAAAVSPFLIKEYKEKLNVELLAGYGLTESANLVSGNPESLHKPESVGLFYPNQEYKIVDGELWLKGKNMFDGYIGADVPAFEDGWFRTGDLVRVDDEGFLYITGRIKEIIVLSNGENVSPAEVETHFNALPFIQDSQVFEAVNEQGTHILALEVVPRMSEVPAEGKENPVAFITAELEKVNNSLPGYQRVSRITVRQSDFERTPSMKIKRYTLQQ